ncbi:hypothetical protein OT109_02780 [Phycisphaeraceae bacterium D3-23]
MDKQPEKTDRPLWVQVGLWGLPNRLSAWLFFWLSMALVVGGLVLAFIQPLCLVSVLFAFSAWWYWACIRWVDQHQDW